MKFSHRAAVEDTDIYRRRIWKADDGIRRISEITRKLEANRVIYYAERKVLTEYGLYVWEIISKHKRKDAAMTACLDDRNKHREILEK